MTSLVFRRVLRGVVHTRPPNIVPVSQVSKIFIGKAEDNSIPLNPTSKRRSSFTLAEIHNPNVGDNSTITSFRFRKEKTVRYRLKVGSNQRLTNRRTVRSIVVQRDLCFHDPAGVYLQYLVPRRSSRLAQCYSQRC